MVKIKNLTNSPHDLVIRLPAMGSVTAEFAPEYLTAMEGMGYFEITRDEPAPKPQLDHDGDGKAGGVADSSPLTDAEEAELIEAMSDDELRDFIERKAGKAPHPRTGHDKLVDKAKEAAAGEDG